MEHFLVGAGMGLGLTVMAGPITLSIIESSIEGGRPGGIAAAAGTWISDLIYIALTLIGGTAIIDKFSMKADTPAVYIGGGIILLGFGIGFWRLRKKPVDLSNSSQNLKSLAGYFGLGFSINTFNPFSLVFWSTVALTMVLGEELSTGQTIAFYGGIMAMLMIGDSLKAILSGWMRQMLSSRGIQLLRSIVAICFAILGVAMIVRAFLL